MIRDKRRLGTPVLTPEQAARMLSSVRNVVVDVSRLRSRRVYLAPDRPAIGRFRSPCVSVVPECQAISVKSKCLDGFGRPQPKVYGAPVKFFEPTHVDWHGRPEDWR